MLRYLYVRRDLYVRRYKYLKGIFAMSIANSRWWAIQCSAVVYTQPVAYTARDEWTRNLKTIDGTMSIMMMFLKLVLSIKFREHTSTRCSTNWTFPTRAFWMEGTRTKERTKRQKRRQRVANKSVKLRRNANEEVDLPPNYGSDRMVVCL